MRPILTSPIKRLLEANPGLFQSNKPAKLGSNLLSQLGKNSHMDSLITKVRHKKFQKKISLFKSLPEFSET